MGRVVLLVCFTVAAAARAQDLADGKDVYGPCAACHGPNGEGGKGGEYPRIAGQPASFIVASLRQFQDRKRMNLPMFPYTEPRELSERDMKDVAAYLASIKLPSRPPELKATDSALDRLLALERVLVVPRVSGDEKEGQELFQKRCARCHGKYGQGRELREAPRLLGQYPSYLLEQVEAFRKGVRGADEADPMNGVLQKLSPKQVNDVLAWLTSIQEKSEELEADPAADE